MTKQYYTFSEIVRLDEFKGLFKQATLRTYASKNTDGFNRCVYKVGGRVLIDVNKFRAWIRGEFKK